MVEAGQATRFSRWFSSGDSSCQQAGRRLDLVLRWLVVVAVAVAVVVVGSGGARSQQVADATHTHNAGHLLPFSSPTRKPADTC